MSCKTCILGCVAGLLAGGVALAQWDPSNGEWGKSNPDDLRVMTYNIHDHICSTADKSEGYNGWHALARIVAAMKPDILLLQEAGDNDGNGTGSQVDSVADLETTIGLFLHGGSDPFVPGIVEAYVQKYAPGYDLPHVFVSSITDDFNRNVLLSRFPFADLNGDTVAARPDISGLYPDLYAPGGTGGIRGFMFVEFDLPNAVYAGDLVVGQAHLKAGSSSSDKQQRTNAARNVAYYIDYLFNGAGTGIPDPRNKILDSPPATSILDDDTPVVIGGDWNEDEWYNGRKGPADWLIMAELTGGDDGTDRDRSDAFYDYAAEPYSGARGTAGSGYKYDYLAWQDSIAGLRRAFIFYSNALSSVPSWIPSELQGFPNGAHRPSGIASDHRPVICDLVLPAASAWELGDLNCDHAVDFGDINPFIMALSNPDRYAQLYPDCDIMNGDINEDGLVDFGDINPFVGLLTQPR